MNNVPQLIDVDEFIVSGLSVRTSNKEEQHAATAKLPLLWQAFLAQKLTETMPMYGVYANYESGVTGSYSVTAGVKINAAQLNSPKITVKAGSYLVFKGQGQHPQTVIHLWNNIWGYFSTPHNYKRCFLTDFECYQSNGEVAIYIGVIQTDVASLK
jgi:predicted transcriptional regulator YdeE